MTLFIRHATTYDIDTIYTIEEQCFEEEFRFDKDLFYYFLLGRRGDIFLVAEDEHDLGKIIVGFIIAFLNDNLNYEIVTLNIHPKRQRSGIGTKLLMEIETMIISKVKELRQLETFSIELTVYEKNIAAKNLYEKLGYKEISREPNYYPRNRTGIKMLKKITLKY
ncbi:MAG: GNAT family N-acetyltransferase [Candidatus Heimdallarchaeota archaeon]